MGTGAGQTPSPVSAGLVAPERLRDEAEQVAARLREVKAEESVLEARRMVVMGELHDAGVAWADIGLIFGMSAPGAMYASGRAKRTKRGG